MNENIPKLFQSRPPRLFPDDPNDRPVIEQLLAQVAAGDAGGYEEALETYNRLADKQGVPRFPRVFVVKETEPAPLTPVEKAETKKAVMDAVITSETTATLVLDSTELVTSDATAEVKVKKPRKKRSPPPDAV